MSTDLSTFDPADIGELIDELGDQMGGVATKWWNANKVAVAGNLESLARATVRTRAALIEGRISEQTAAETLAMQESAFQDAIAFTEFMTLVLAERLKNTVLKVIGWAIFNRTGLNLFPDQVKP